MAFLADLLICSDCTCMVVQRHLMAQKEFFVVQQGLLVVQHELLGVPNGFD